MEKMKIALLNLQYDNNYGGNLQRYALITILQRVGYDVTHLNLRFNFNPLPWYRMAYIYAKRIVKRVFGYKNVSVFPERRNQKQYEDSCKVTDAFYYRYIPHTKVIGSKKALSRYTDYDAFVVGSDQVWRKMIAKIYGIDTFFFDYLQETIKAKRIAYGASLGTDENELDDDDLARLTPLYKRFDAVSVREDTSLRLFEEYGWTSPQAKWVLDPTLLLEKEDYLQLIKDGNTIPSEGSMFCYILDDTEEKTIIINEEAGERNLTPFQIGLKGQASIEQWLRSFADAEFIVTDSYHGLVFSVIFNKPFRLIRNQFRGAARFDAIFKACGITSDNGSNLNWTEINSNLNNMKSFSREWLKQNIK